MIQGSIHLTKTSLKCNYDIHTAPQVSIRREDKKRGGGSFFGSHSKSVLEFSEILHTTFRCQLQRKLRLIDLVQILIRGLIIISCKLTRVMTVSKNSKFSKLVFCLIDIFDIKINDILKTFVTRGRSRYVLQLSISQLVLEFHQPQKKHYGLHLIKKLKNNCN